MERLRPPRPDWYEEFYAQAMEEGMRSYEAEVCSMHRTILLKQLFKWYFILVYFSSLLGSCLVTVQYILED